ncbi:MAG: hypothetical protein OXJ64_16700, partial [Boseongicola sp.]|nr:hypothetical protein [Boseongicola sp.]
MRKGIMRKGIVSAVCVVILATGTPRAADFSSALNAAVLDWCDARSGTFDLPEINIPYCTVDGGTAKLFGGTAYIGVMGTTDLPPAKWWELRSYKGHPFGPDRLGVLWYVPGPASKELCREALSALKNPARVPVVLVGPGAAVCE